MILTAPSVYSHAYGGYCCGGHARRWAVRSLVKTVAASTTLVLIVGGDFNALREVRGGLYEGGLRAMYEGGSRVMRQGGGDHGCGSAGCVKLW